LSEIRRNSKQRQVILEELRKEKSHPTAASLYRIVRRRLPKISLGTIYRNLEILTSEGVINRLYSAGSEARYDGNIDKCYHIRCTQCGRYEDLFGFSLNKANVNKKKLSGYKISGHYFEFFGICPDCQKKNGNKNSKSKAKRRRKN
jgi:Fur family ferric uptake transcriptional regulator